MSNFTPVASLVGGALIGLAAAMLLLFNGRIAGISGIFGGIVVPRAGDTAWRAWFVGGLVAGGLLLRVVRPASFPAAPAVPIAAVAVAGFLVGLGTTLGSGCTSGHGVCGLSRLSVRSLAATLTFMGAGALTVLAVRHLLGGLR